MSASARPAEVVTVERWPSEQPLTLVAALVAVVIWLLLAVSIVGILYVAILGLAFWLMHTVFIAHVRGSGVKLGADQFPELYAAVERLSQNLGLAEMPQCYIMQAGGALNALATRFLGGKLIILYSDLLDACGDNTAARDMIIAHELGHHRAGHLRWHWFFLPALVIPFLGTALSRAREYTCDRYGLAGAADRDGALTGLTILAAGAKHGPLVDRWAMARQADDLQTGWMTIGQWLSSHPPLAKRLAALDPALAPAGGYSHAGALRAGAVIAAFILVVGALGGLVATGWTALLKQAQLAGTTGGASVRGEPADARALVDRDFSALAELLADEWRTGRPLPTDVEALYVLWSERFPDAEPPIDPFDGARYGYETGDDWFVLWSSGPDMQPGTTDDPEYDSRTVGILSER